MAYEQVDVTRLRDAIISCQNSLNNNTTKDLAGRLGDNNVWQADAKKNLKTALEKLSGSRYDALKKKLDTYLNVVGNIREYQNLQEENKELEQQCNNLKKDLYYTEYYTDYSKNKKGETVSTRKSRQTKNYSVENRINDAKQKIESNKYRMSKLQSNINNSI